MIRTAIVEDDAEEMQLIKSYLERCSKEQCFNCVIDLYTDGDEIVDGVRAGYDLIIMDIELPDAVIIILMVLDLLTIPAFMYAYVKSMEGDSK